MNHFFCEFPEKAKDRIKKIYQLYNRNPSESVRLVDKTVSSCKKCLEVYLNCSPEWWFEKKRVCTNFCPEKLYHWELLSDEDIFSEYKACMGCRTAYFGFKSIVFLIKDKTRSNESWSKVQLESVELTSKEIKFLLDGRLKKDVCFFKALNLLFSKVPASYRDQIKSILFETYKNDKEMSKDITDLRIEALNCLGQFIEKYTIEPTEVGMVYEDLLGSKRIDLLIKHYSVFENLNFNISEIFQKTSTFDLTTFSFIVSHIEKIDITYSILNGVLKYMLKSYQTKCAFDTINIDLLFHKIVMFLVKNSEYRTNGLINKLALANFAQFKDGAYWLLYLNLLFSIPITKVSLSHPKGLLLFQLTDKKIRELVLADPNAVSEFISEINEFKPFVDSFESIGIEISKRLKFDFSTAVQFTNTFGTNQAMLDNIIENLTFQSPNIDILSESARFSCSEFLSLLKQRMKLNNTGRGDPDSIVHIHAGLSGNPSGNARLLTTVPDSKACFDELKSSIEVDDINIRDAQVRSQKRIPKIIIKPSTHSKSQQFKEFVLNDSDPLVSTRVETNIFVEVKRRNSLPVNREPKDKLKKHAAQINQDNADKEVIVSMDGYKNMRNISNAGNIITVEPAAQTLAIDHIRPKQLSQADEKTQTNKKLVSSMVSQIAQRSNTVFFSQQTARKPVDIDSQDAFFEYVLNPFRPPISVDFVKIPTCFDSFRQYFDVFNPLQINETISSIKSALLENSKYFECAIHDFDRVLRIRAVNFQFDVYDLLYFSQHKTQFSFSYRLDDEAKDGSFVGIVTDINACHSSDGSHHTSIVEIKVSTTTAISKASYQSSNGNQPSSLLFNTSGALYYRYCGNITSNLREYTALRVVKESGVLKYILRPSFMKDFQESTIFWDDKKLGFAKNLSNLKYCSSLTQNGSQVVLQNLLVAAHGLNLSQAEAVSKCFFSREKFFLIQGPPGTGKTTTIISIISTFLLIPQTNLSRSTVLNIDQINDHISSLKILICAPSNTAIDVVVTRLASGIKNFRGGVTHVSFLRVGASTNPDVHKYTLEYLVNRCASQPRSGHRHSLVSTASVICATLSSSVSDSICLSKFDLIIIDEACQATELSTIIPFKYNPNKVIMIGDPNQLPPTVISDQSQLQVSLFERLLSHHQPVMLDVQYRMHPDICKLSSLFFYDNRIETFADIAQLRRKSGYGDIYGFRPLNFIDILVKQEKIDDFKSYYNPVECSICYRISKELFRRYGNTLKIAVLTPYKGQANMLMKNRNYEKMGIEINTIDGFQGKECDVVILSTVRRFGLGFTCDFRRINVAMTRSRVCLILLGNKKCLSQSSVWSGIIDYITQQGQYFTSKSLELFLSTL